MNVTNPIGIVALWDNGIPTPVILAYNFQLTDGHVRVKVPDVFSGDAFSLVCQYRFFTKVTQSEILV